MANKTSKSMTESSMKSSTKSPKDKHHAGNDSTVFRFMDLPLELRNDIYLLVLKAPKDIRLSRHKVRNGPLRKTKYGMRPTVSHVFIKGLALGTSNGRRRRLPLGEVLPMAIMRVSKVFNAEAASVFYGENRFTFDNAYCFAHLLSYIGEDKFSLLKLVNIRAVSPRSAVGMGALRYLKAPEQINLRANSGSGLIDTKGLSVSLSHAIEAYVKGSPTYAEPLLDLNKPEQKQRFDLLDFTVLGIGGDDEMFKSYILKEWKITKIKIKREESAAVPAKYNREKGDSNVKFVMADAELKRRNSRA